jgi:ribose 5-phosphate isomerase A
MSAMNIIERALQLVPAGALVGLGSGRAAQAFVRGLGESVRAKRMEVRGVPTSEETADLARQYGIPLVTLDVAGQLDLTVDGADEVAPNLDLIKGYGRAMVREKIVAACSRQLIILVGEEKLVPQLGTRGKLPVEVLPLALSLCTRELSRLGCRPVPWTKDGRLGVTDNGNFILDCGIDPISDPLNLELEVRAIPGVIGTGLFLQMADRVLIGKGQDHELVEERRSSGKTNP